MKIIRVCIILFITQFCCSAMQMPSKKNSAVNPDIVTKMALSSVMFSAMYALADISSGNFSKASVWSALKDGFITGAVVACSMKACDELPTTVPGFIWVAAVGVAPAALVINNFLLKRAIGLSAS